MLRGYNELSRFILNKRSLHMCELPKVFTQMSKVFIEMFYEFIEVSSPILRKHRLHPIEMSREFIEMLHPVKKTHTACTWLKCSWNSLTNKPNPTKRLEPRWNSTACTTLKYQRTTIIALLISITCLISYSNNTACTRWKCPGNLSKLIFWTTKMCVLNMLYAMSTFNMLRAFSTCYNVLD